MVRVHVRQAGSSSCTVVIDWETLRGMVEAGWQVEGWEAVA